MSTAVARVSVQTADFNLTDEVARLRRQDAQIGAVVSFVGTVREWLPADRHAAPGPDACLELEHYPGMTESAIEAMIDEAQRRFELRGVRVIHRVGRLAVGEQIVLVVTASSHRGQAFLACEFLMDWLKTQAPFWKKEISATGSRWVEAKVSDDEALARWRIQP
ncbi:molybdenum cofactor biosynthesis protein MoaE [Aquabacterium sp. CECT 9606]|uniref:molybdenum cofactor biosynthesis protein MoaE n=1 Tax=Aquabacterium sp. CECT 9606 TaxID=2845822 RepID=UPI001E2C08C4|nr:molybdenum cofactor biosynthesis protein MoaE [Aquabacterium sp. CECT 9606]CAH0349306.1 Molybdopterin synthase catalytic subunit [Aquabacterium sp. CECT 9606]